MNVISLERIDQSTLEALLCLEIEQHLKRKGQRDFSIDPDASFSSLGLESIDMVELVAALEEQLNCKLEPELAFNYPTVHSLSKFLINSSTENANV